VGFLPLAKERDVGGKGFTLSLLLFVTVLGSCDSLFFQPHGSDENRGQMEVSTEITSTAFGGSPISPCLVQLCATDVRFEKKLATIIYRCEKIRPISFVSRKNRLDFLSSFEYFLG